MKFVRMRLPTPTSVFDSYWHFAAERQRVYFKRVRGMPPPWTADPVIAHYRFTNAYRASDRESQFLIRYVIYEGPQSNREVFFRTLLFRLFNKRETWDLLEARLGTLTADGFDVPTYAHVLQDAMARGVKIFSPAYIMPSRAPGYQSPTKHENLLALLRRMLDDCLYDEVLSSTAENAFRKLVSYPLVGNFLAYQFLTDLGYSSNATYGEDEFVIPGPGAVSGIRKCFSDLGDYSESDLIRWVRDSQNESFATRGIPFETLWGRELHLIDCQNLFCETDKYARVVHPDAPSARTRIKRKFGASSDCLEPWFPPKWLLNDRISAMSVVSARNAQGVLHGIL